jgi:hypothetical protein
MLAAIAERHNAYVLMVNQVGGNDGSSSTARRDGRRICRDPLGQRHRTFLAVVRRPGGRILPKSSRHPDSDRSCGCPNNPSTSFLGSTWQRTDEWYNFATNPRGNVHVLLTWMRAPIRVEPWEQTIRWRGARSTMVAGRGIPRTAIRKTPIPKPSINSNVLAGIQYAAGITTVNCQ